jgi:hypothetical protein
MSTTYGKIILRDHTFLEVEAFGIGGCVKLIPDKPIDPLLGIAIDDPGQINSLIFLLEIARDHVWENDTFFQAFFSPNLGTYTSNKRDLSDLGDEYLSNAVANMRSIGKEPPIEALKRLEGK